MPWIDANRKVIGDDDAYTADDGTQYPGKWDKASLGLVHVDRPAEPTDCATTGWHVDDANQWIWETRPFTAAEQYPHAIAMGCQIVSTATPAISGTYAIDQSAIADVMSEVQFIAAFAEFSNMAQTMVWPVADGVVAFPSPAAAMSVFKAIAQYVTAWKQYAGGIASTAPTSPITTP